MTSSSANSPNRKLVTLGNIGTACVRIELRDARVPAHIGVQRLSLQPKASSRSRAKCRTFPSSSQCSRTYSGMVTRRPPRTECEHEAPGEQKGGRDSDGAQNPRTAVILRFMALVGVLAQFEFKAGRETAAQGFFDAGKLTVQDQPTSTSWYAFRIGPSTYGAFAVFASDEDREALLSAGGPRASQTNAELFETAPSFQKVDIVAAREGS